MKKLIFVLTAACSMLLLPFSAYADIPALPREPQPKDTTGQVVLIVIAVILIGVALLVKLLRKK